MLYQNWVISRGVQAADSHTFIYSSEEKGVVGGKSTKLADQRPKIQHIYTARLFTVLHNESTSILG